MCGIVGAVSRRNVASILLEGLKRLEYRGYDSSGIALIQENKLDRVRVKGKVGALVEKFSQAAFSGHTGIAHTRWATHGKPSEHNAHPHMASNRLAVVHNGIIENYQAIKNELIRKGYAFYSETDTEVIAVGIWDAMQQGQDLLSATQLFIKQLKGAYALGIIDEQHPETLIAVRSGSPLVIGVGFEENFLASDPLALQMVTDQFIFLEEGDVAKLTPEVIAFYNHKGEPVVRKAHEKHLAFDAADKGDYRHFMQKEIFEQPAAVEATLTGAIANNKVLEQVFGENATEIFDTTKAIQIVACGTSYHAGVVAKYWIERFANMPCRVEIASEFRYRVPVLLEKTLVVGISQSGETADTLAALRSIQSEHCLAKLCLCNVAQSTMVRESDMRFITKAGPEIGVCSTKAFTTQLTALLLLTSVLSRRNKAITQEIQEKLESSFVEALKELPYHIEQVLELDKPIKRLASQFKDKAHCLFLGRGLQFPIALEGALKLKELSYIHAEAYPAGELKHGPLALVDEQMPVIFLAPSDGLIDKIKSNIQEIAARGGKTIVFADEAARFNSSDVFKLVLMPHVPECLMPMIYTIALQLLSYHVAVYRGTDVDQPRNLAKSVTVE